MAKTKVTVPKWHHVSEISKLKQGEAVKMLKVRLSVNNQIKSNIIYVDGEFRYTIRISKDKVIKAGICNHVQQWAIQ